jgi:hypothetical protein
MKNKKIDIQENQTAIAKQDQSLVDQVTVSAERQVQHKPVLLNEVLQYLAPQPGKVYVDVTLGGGGHTRAIVKLLVWIGMSR